MEQNHINCRIPPSDFGGIARSPQPNYSSRAVQEALEHLASVDLIDLCNEAKIEHCRATRDLRSCGRYVQHVLNSCGHASLCSECSQRCDICPICRIPIPKNGNRLRPRLYYECIEAGLISKICGERFQENEDGENQLDAVQRLYSLFDVAMENNLFSLICHYITDVCMDESAVSSNPVIAFLLDEVVVKDWCKRTFRNIVVELQGIYNLEAEEMKARMHLLLKLSVHLAGIFSVLEVLVSSFKGGLSGQPHDLQLLQECILKTKQHLEIMAWCARHQFLDNVRSRYTDLSLWRSAVRVRKSEAVKRSWPDAVNQSAEFSAQAGSLFIEDALENLEIEEGHMPEMGEDLELAPLQKDEGLFFRLKVEGLAGCYPFESLRAAVDVLFLRGSSDLVVAKHAIFLYYLFDRHWTMADDAWRHIVDDFAATFGIHSHSLLESLTFYLLDDHTEKALQEACDLLPEISGPSTHPKIAEVLLERRNPEMALMVMRWSGREGQIVLLSEAVTAVRVRVECGLLTEAFMYQRMLCTKVKEKQVKSGPSGHAPDDLKGDSKTWKDWVDILVTDICCLCIKRNLVDKIIEFPWNLDEEKHLHECLFDFAIHDPSSTAGSLLVVFYLQRYRYAEAYQVNSKLHDVEQAFVSSRSLSEEVLSRMRSASHFRAGLVAQSIELLPQVQQQQVKTGKLLSTCYSTPDEVRLQAESNLPLVPEPKASSVLVPDSSNSSVVVPPKHSTPFKASLLETPARLGGSTRNPHFELGNNGSPSVLHKRLFTNSERAQKPELSGGMDFKCSGMATPGIHDFSHINTTPLKETGRTSLKVLSNNGLHQHPVDRISPEVGQNGFAKQFRNASPPYFHRVTADPVATSGSYHGHQNDGDTTRSQIVAPGDDLMDVAWSAREKDSATDKRSLNGGLRWRSDESSDEESQNPERFVGAAPTTSGRGFRKSRSTLHRVMPSGRERYSMAFFLEPNADCIVKCLESCCSESNPPRFPPIRSGDHVQERLRAAYGI